MPTRRRALGLALSAAVGLAGCTRPGGGPTAAGTGTDTGAAADGLPVRLETVTDRPDSPLAFVEAPDGTRYVADRPGRILRLDGGAVETALDLADAVMTGGERGLLGLALHPDFGSNGRLYVRYSSASRAGTPPTYSHTFVLAEFRVRADGTIDRTSERTLLEIPEPQGNHNSGSLAFGPDGYLYVGVGDGGGGGDRGTGHVEDWYDAVPGGNGQDVTRNLLGSLLRIDVNDRSGERPYGVPDDNPLVGDEGLDEQYVWGLRNPWGISFDGTDCYVADVGQRRREEVNLVQRGGNYGWNVREGTRCFGADDCPSRAPDGRPLRDPVVEYPHSGATVSGVAVVGGHVYRGDAIPALSGRYVFGDLNANGDLFVATPAEEGPWSTDVLPVAEASRDDLGRLFAVGRDRADELYVLTGSGVHRLAPTR
ncbi:MAG: sorbosone dehydrogenase family protein [Haloferacaceae archaeon]